MSKEVKHIRSPGIRAAVNGRELTLEPIRMVPIELEIREVESLIPAGFRVNWVDGTITETDDDGIEIVTKISVDCGAGFGSPWLSFTMGDRQFCVHAEEIIEAFLRGLKSLPDA